MKRESSFVRQVAIAVGIIACAAGLVGCPSGVNERFTVDIQRHYNTEQEKDLILVAENTYPSREEVAQLYPAGTNPQDLPENVWWYFGSFGNEYRLPYAITTETIEYYKQQIREDAVDYVREGTFRRYPEATESFYYDASIHFFTSFKGEEGITFSNVYVVNMLLSFGGSVGPGTGGGFGQDRVVILTPEGIVLQVQGDGPADVGNS